MAKKKKSRKPPKKGMSDSLLLGGGLLLGLYLLTRPGEGGTGGTGLPAINIFGTGAPGAQGPAGETGQTGTSGKDKTSQGPSIIEVITGGVSKAGGEIISGVASVPGAIVLGTAKETIISSEATTSKKVFGGETRIGSPAFMATGAPPGATSVVPLTYSEWISAQPAAFRVASGVGNIISGQYAAEYGKYTAEETKKGISSAGGYPTEYTQRFARLDPITQSFVGLGQAITVPFGGGGAAGWALGFKKAIGWK